MNSTCIGSLIVVIRRGEQVTAHSTGESLRGHAADEIWFIGWPRDDRAKRLLKAADPLLNFITRDMVHATEELCMEFLCPPLPDEDLELEAIHRAEERANFPDADLDEPLGERTCSIDNPDCESCT